MVFYSSFVCLCEYEHVYVVSTIVILLLATYSPITVHVLHVVVCVCVPSISLCLQDLAQYGVKCDYCVVHPDSSLPTSHVIVSQEKGTRTIVHFR